VRLGARVESLNHFAIRISWDTCSYFREAGLRAPGGSCLRQDIGK
jgi:hypothetical protein